MIFNGFQKMTMLDFPGRIACTLFSGGCNFRCPFCHNAGLVIGQMPEQIPEEEILSYLNKRKGVLDGVCFTGGEPLLQRDIAEFMRKVKDMGYKIKLDTNGSNPEKLIELVRSGLVDYVAMDIKNSKEKYALTCGTEIDLPAIERAVEFLKEGGVDYEFRTTIVREFHTESDMIAIGKWLEGAEKYFLQAFVDSGAIIGEGLSPLPKTEMERFVSTLKPFVKKVQIRGI